MALRAFQRLKAFKSRIKNWKLKIFPCRICKFYISNVDFIKKKKKCLGDFFSKALKFDMFFGYCIIRFFLALLSFNFFLDGFDLKSVSRFIFMDSLNIKASVK